jgi:hypothetical protein
MNNLLNNSFSTSVPLASVISSILFMIYGNIGLHLLAAICLIIPGLVFLFISLYLFIQFERLVTIELDLDTMQLGLMQLAVILFVINSMVIITP